MVFRLQTPMGPQLECSCTSGTHDMTHYTCTNAGDAAMGLLRRASAACLRMPELLPIKHVSTARIQHHCPCAAAAALVPAGSQRRCLQSSRRGTGWRR